MKISLSSSCVAQWGMALLVGGYDGENKFVYVSQILLNSMHLYQPCIRVISIDNLTPARRSDLHVFPETRFFAVTAYQNKAVRSK